LFPKCFKTHLRASVTSKNFPGAIPRTSAFRGRDRDKGGMGKGRGREGNRKVGKRGEGKGEGWEGGGEGKERGKGRRGGREDLGNRPLTGKLNTPLVTVSVSHTSGSWQWKAAASFSMHGGQMTIKRVKSITDWVVIMFKPNVQKGCTMPEMLRKVASRNSWMKQAPPPKRESQDCRYTVSWCTGFVPKKQTIALSII
jgi:hypothetical protein